MNRMEEIANLFGLKLGEYFNITGNEIYEKYNPYRFTLEGIEDCNSFVNFIDLVEIATGVCGIEKINNKKQCIKMLKEVLEQQAIWQKINNEECPNLEDANLEGIDFKGADLSNANLKGANLAGAILEGANLTKANLEGANLEGANFRYTNLRGADLRYANILGVEFTCADLRGVKFECSCLPLWWWWGAKVDEDVIYQLLYQVCSLTCDSNEFKEIKDKIKILAKKFYLVKEYGEIE